MCWTEIEHLSWCDVRSWIATQPFMEDGTGDYVDPFHIESHSCHRRLLGPPSAGNHNLQPCGFHTCCLTRTWVNHRCHHAPPDAVSCTNLYVSHGYSYLPREFLSQFDRPSWRRAAAPTYPIIGAVYSLDQRVEACDGHPAHLLRQAFFEAARQLHQAKKECVEVRNEVDRVVTAVADQYDRRSSEEHDAAFTRYCLDQLAPLKRPAMAAVTQVRALPELALAVFRAAYDVKLQVLGRPDPDDHLLAELYSYPIESQLRWVQTSFAGPLLEIQDTMDFFREIMCRLEAHHQSLTGMTYEGSIIRNVPNIMG